MVEQMGSSVSVVMIAHRLSTVMGCDKIIVIDKGQVLEEGNHSELMENDKTYASLVRTQMVKEAKEATEAVDEEASEKDAASEDDVAMLGMQSGWGKGKGNAGKGNGQWDRERNGGKWGGKEGGRAGKEGKWGGKEGGGGKDGKRGKKGKGDREGRDGASG